MSSPEPRAPFVVCIIPALNEARVIGQVVEGIRPHVDRVIVADNGSSDGTGKTAAAAGADVVHVPVAGYGRACLAGVAAAGDADIILFMDGDGSDDPDEAPALLAPILAGRVDLVIGSRALGETEPGALSLPQRFGNRLACFLMRRIWNSPFTDLGPFRAICRSAYDQLGMQAPTFGWTVEMQARALKRGLRVAEAPAAYRRRVGKSKISGTVRGVVMAGVYILGTIVREALTRHASPAGRSVSKPRACAPGKAIAAETRTVGPLGR